MNFFWHFAQHRPTFTPRQVTVCFGTTSSSVSTGHFVLNGLAPGAGTGLSSAAGAVACVVGAGAACCACAAAKPMSADASAAAAAARRARIRKGPKVGSATAPRAVAALLLLVLLLARLLGCLRARRPGARRLELGQVRARVLEEVLLAVLAAELDQRRAVEQLLRLLHRLAADHARLQRVGLGLRLDERGVDLLEVGLGVVEDLLAAVVAADLDHARADDHVARLGLGERVALHDAGLQRVARLLRLDDGLVDLLEVAALSGLELLRALVAADRGVAAVLHEVDGGGGQRGVADHAGLERVAGLLAGDHGGVVGRGRRRGGRGRRGLRGLGVRVLAGGRAAVLREGGGGERGQREGREQVADADHRGTPWGGGSRGITRGA